MIQSFLDPCCHQACLVIWRKANEIWGPSCVMTLPPTGGREKGEHEVIVQSLIIESWGTAWRAGKPSELPLRR